ncbi:type II secretion system protein GspM [Microvirga terricola]|uniref:General secretion pathway protein M n=1 Tax=Microvirga terricola TaxID=2719797 RepID=A0ABX0VFW6_9HYPH|nr:type II secretion system protein GspM [Microvirga terricola]NIX78438.1 hypothetical protein [Microvirga terricola]
MTRATVSRWGALAITVAGLGVFAMGVIWPFVDTFLEQRAGILAQKNRLGDLVRRRLDHTAATAVPVMRTGLLSASSDEEAASRLGAHVRAILQARGGEAEVVRVIATTKEAGLSTLRATITGRAPENEVLEILHILETESPTLFFDTIQLRRLESDFPASEVGWIALTGIIHVYLERPIEPGSKP